MENENEKNEEQPTSTEADVNTEVSVYQDARALLVDGFASVSNAMRIVGDHPETSKLWKGASLPTALLWKMEELVEGMEAVIGACEASDNQGEEYNREAHQVEVSDAILDGMGIDTMLLGVFGSDRLRAFADSYVGAQVARNRKPGFWYGPIRRVVGNIAYGVHIVETEDKEHAKLQAKPRNRAMLVRNMLMTKSQKREWDTVVVPKPKPKPAHVVLTATAERNNTIDIGVAISGLDPTNLQLTVDALFAAEFQKDYVYGKLSKAAKPALHGKKLSNFGSFKTLVKKFLTEEGASEKKNIAFRFVLKGSKASNWMTTTGKVKKLKAGDYKIEVFQ